MKQIIIVRQILIGVLSMISSLPALGQVDRVSPYETSIQPDLPTITSGGCFSGEGPLGYSSSDQQDNTYMSHYRQTPARDIVVCEGSDVYLVSPLFNDQNPVFKIGCALFPFTRLPYSFSYGVISFNGEEQKALRISDIPTSLDGLGVNFKYVINNKLTDIFGATRLYVAPRKQQQISLNLSGLKINGITTLYPVLSAKELSFSELSEELVKDSLWDKTLKTALTECENGVCSFYDINQYMGNQNTKTPVFALVTNGDVDVHFTSLVKGDEGLPSICN